MTELTNSLIEQMIDCKDDDMPSARIVQLMASEISRIRSYGDMVQAPEQELIQRCVTLHAKLKSNPKSMEALTRVSDYLRKEIGVSLQQTLLDVLTYVAGDTPTDQEGGGWTEISLDLLKDTERVIHDSVGFGSSQGVHTHNSSLNNLRKYIENSDGQPKVMVPIAFIAQMHKAVSEVVYGKEFSMSYREELQNKLMDLVKNFSS